MAQINPALLARFDEMLMGITQQAGNGIDGLLDSVFSFLQRRTDFFYEAEPGDKMGFPPQYAEGLVSHCFFLVKQDRSTGTSRSIRLSTRKSSHQRARISRNDGSNTERTLRKPSSWQRSRLRPRKRKRRNRKHQRKRSRKNPQLRSQRPSQLSSLKSRSLTLPCLLLASQKKLSQSLKWIRRSVRSTEQRRISTTGLRASRTSRFRLNSPRGPHRSKSSLTSNQRG